MHTEQIPPLAWVVLAFVVLLTLAIIFILFAIMRDPEGLRRLNNQRKMPRSEHATETLRKATETLRHPFAEENRQMDELSGLVRDLNRPGPGSPPDESEPPQTLQKK